MKKNMKKSQGFTLAELLIVVAIIAVLVAISIPVFTSQLEKAREATDAANVRSAYAEVVTQSLTDSTTDNEKTVSLKQAQAGWQTAENGTNISSLQTSDNTVTVTGDPKANGTCTIKYAHSDTDGGVISITFN